MPVLIAVAGLPGSGKSHYVHREAREHRYVAVSDVTQDDWRHWPRVVDALRSGRSAIVDSATFTDPAAREDLEARVWQACARAEIEWRFFANDPSGCLSNILRDALDRDRETVGRLRSFFRRAPGYTIPLGAQVVPVYRHESGTPQVEIVAL